MAYPVQMYVTLVDAAGTAPQPQMYVAAVDPGGNYLGATIQPQGRLTLTTATPVLTSTVSASATVLYTPYQGSIVPLYNGTTFVPTQFSELTNTLADSTTNPAAGQALGAYDLFVWNNAGTLTLSRGPVWNYNSTVTVTSATPAVVTWTNHGMTTGMVVQFTGGPLPTGISALTNYWITVTGASTFNISTSPANMIAGTLVATSSTGTGVAAQNFGFSRATGGALTLQNGIYLNTTAITNGPAALRGTYVGTIYTDAAGATVSQNLGSTAAGGGQGWLGVWNAYNRRLARTNTKDSTGYTYTTATMRVADANDGNSLYLVRGLNEDIVACGYTQRISLAAAVAAFVQLGVSLDSITAVSADANEVQVFNNAAAAIAGTPYSRYVGYPGIGIHTLRGMEIGDGTNANSMNTNTPHGGLKGEVWC